MNEESPSRLPEQAHLPDGVNQRVEARIAAIKPLYSNEVSQEKKEAAELALDMYSVYESNEYEESIKPDIKFLKELLVGVLERQDALDEKIVPYLQSSWRMERLGAVMCALLRVAVYELMAYEELTIKIIINEYINIARCFFEEKEVRFVNGVLDKVAKEVRG